MPGTASRYPYAFIFFVLLVAFFPVISLQFAIKNDFFSGYFPAKFFISESLRAGQFPAWNPYINYGLPVYGDMSSGFWNPVTWLIGITVGYNAYSFTIELLLYLFAAGIGMYVLSGFWNLDPFIRLIAGAAYMCCGYQIGQLQHFNWISGAAFLPACTYCLLVLFKKPGSYRLLLAVFFFILFTTCAHPGLLIGGLYFFTALSVVLIYTGRKDLAGKKLPLMIGIGVLLFLAGTAGMICGYLEIIPLFSRSGPIQNELLKSNSTTSASWISFVLPLSISKKDSIFQNDISLRNCYFGLLLFASFVSGFFSKKTYLEKFFISCALIFLLISSELISPVYKYLPFINHVRLNGEFRIFAIFCMIIYGAIAIQNLILKRDLRRIIFVLRVIFVIVGFLCIWSAVMLIQKNESIWFVHEIFQADGTRASLRRLIQRLSFYDVILLHGIVQLVLLAILIGALKKLQLKKVVIIALTDLFLAAWLLLPYTGVGMRSVKTIQNLVNQSPIGIPRPELLPEKILAEHYPYTDSIIGSWSMYSKQIAQARFVPYPVNLVSTGKYFESGYRDIFMNKPWIFFQNGEVENQDLNVQSYRPTAIRFSLKTSQSDTIIIKQNSHRRWNYSSNGKSLAILTSAYTLIAVPVDAGNHTLQIRYDYADVLWLFIIQMGIFVALTVYLAIKGLRISKMI